MSSGINSLDHIAVMVADLDTALTAEEAAATADVVVISVPIDAMSAGDVPASVAFV